MALKWAQTLTEMDTGFIYFWVNVSNSWNSQDISRLVQEMFRFLVIGNTKIEDATVSAGIINSPVGAVTCRHHPVWTDD